MTITPNETELETDWLSRGIGFLTEPDGVVTAVSRANRGRLLSDIEGRSV